MTVLVETGLEGLIRFFNSSDSKIIKIWNQNCWYILEIKNTPHINRIYFFFLSGSKIIEPGMTLELSYKWIDLELDIQYEGKISLYVSIRRTLLSSEDSFYFKPFKDTVGEIKQWPEDIDVENFFKCEHIEITKLPLYMENISKRFQKLLKEGYKK